MKLLRIASSLSALVICTYMTSCVVSTHRPVPRPAGNAQSSKPLPPGQAKKVTGSQSAKPFAPGQQKKKH